MSELDDPRAGGEDEDAFYIAGADLVQLAQCLTVELDLQAVAFHECVIVKITSVRIGFVVHELDVDDGLIVASDDKAIESTLDESFLVVHCHTQREWSLVMYYEIIR
jgi:hypothetical protein